MKLSEMKAILAERGIQLTKSLGQNFLHDQNQLRRIVALAELSKEDRVLEIGPGLGPLTDCLLAEASEVLAIEKDARLVEVLRSRYGAGEPQHRPTLVHDDALDYLRRERRDWSGWKLVANLPYSVASPLLVELVQGARSPERLVATLQLEVARRLMARPAEPDYGVLTLLVQLDFEPQTWFKIPAGCFFPEPEVDSACVCLRRRMRPLLSPEQRPVFVSLVKQSFSQRRKMMLKLLKERWPEPALQAAFAAIGLSPQTRAEKLALEQFVQLVSLLEPASAGQPATRTEVFDVVNERDEVVGRETRNEVHRRGLMHRAVHILVFNRRGEVFLQKRSMKKDRQPGVWDSSASGHVDSGEPYDTCALRELREEIGLVPRHPLERLFKMPASAETDQEHVWVYRCQSEGPLQLDPEEIETGGWFAPRHVSAWLEERPHEFASAFRLLWREVAASAHCGTHGPG